MFGVLVLRVFNDTISNPGDESNRKMRSFLKLVIISSVSLLVKAIYLGAMSYGIL